MWIEIKWDVFEHTYHLYVNKETGMVNSIKLIDVIEKYQQEWYISTMVQMPIYKYISEKVSRLQTR